MNSFALTGEVLSPAVFTRTQAGNLVANMIIDVEYGFGSKKRSFPLKLCLHGKRAALPDVASAAEGDFVEAVGELRIMSWRDENGAFNTAAELDARFFSIVATSDTVD